MTSDKTSCRNVYEQSVIDALAKEVEWLEPIFDINELENRKAAENYRAAQELKKAQEQGEALKGKTITIYQKTGAGDKLFGSVTAKEIAEAIKNLTNIEVDKKKISLDEPIKSLGEYTAEIKLHANVHIKINVVIAQKE